MIIIRYIRNKEGPRDLVHVSEEVPEIAQKVIHADTFIHEGAVFAVVSKQYDIDNNQLIIYVQ